MSVYFAQRRQGGLVKIGFSRSVVSRLRSMKIKMLGAVAGDLATEKLFHKRFAHLRIRGEWFKPGNDLLRFIQTEAQRHKPDSPRSRNRYSYTHMIQPIFKTRAYAQLTPAESLRFAREFNELSQQQLAELSWIPQPAISAMERGDVQIGADRAARLARVLQVHPAVILYPNWTDDAVARERPRRDAVIRGSRRRVVSRP